MTKRLILLALLPLLLVVACSTGGSSGTPAPAVPEPASPDDGTAALADGSTESRTGTQAQPDQQEQRDVIRTASVTVIVADPEADSERIQQQAEDAGGYVADIQAGRPVPCRGADCPSRTPSGSGSAGSQVEGVLTITVRVPSARYDAVLDEIRSLGDVAALAVTANDVTAQTQDLDARIASQRASVARVRQLMQRANSIDELVRVERELSTRQADLEAMQAQRKRLADAVALATITATLVTPDQAGEIIEPEEHWWDGPVNAFTESWRALMIFLAAITPLLVLGLIALVVVLWLVRRRRARPKPAPEPHATGTDAAPQQPMAATAAERTDAPASPPSGPQAD